MRERTPATARRIMHESSRDSELVKTPLASRKTASLCKLTPLHIGKRGNDVAFPEVGCGDGDLCTVLPVQKCSLLVVVPSCIKRITSGKTEAFRTRLGPVIRPASELM